MTTNKEEEEDNNKTKPVVGDITSARTKIAEVNAPVLTLQKQKDIRAKQWNFQLKTADTHKGSQVQFEKVLTSHHQLAMNNDNLVEQSLKDQDEILMEKLRRRRENSINKSVGKIKDNKSNAFDVAIANTILAGNMTSDIGKPIFKTKKRDSGKGDISLNSSNNILKLIDDTTRMNPFGDGGGGLLGGVRRDRNEAD